MANREAVTESSNVLQLPDRQAGQPRPRLYTHPAGVQSEDILAAALSRSRMMGEDTALVVLRLAEHRELAEAFGDDVAGELTRAVEQRLAACLREPDVACQVRDDEIAVVLDGLGAIDRVGKVVGRMVDQCSGRYNLSTLSPCVKVRAGIALYPVDAEDATELLRYARIALQRGDATINPCQFFSPELLKHRQDKVWMEAELERALAEGRFELHYQPQYAIAGDQVVGVEALVRMIDPCGGTVPPDRFISIAEGNGFIVPLGSWVIRQACKQLSAWRATGITLQRIAVNVSPRQLIDNKLLEVIDSAIAESGLDYSDLELEITEQCVFEFMPRAEQILRQLRDRGVRIAVDDFGTGYCSLAYLAQLPIDVLKMDRSFLVQLGTNPRAGKLVESIVDMAKNLGVAIVAEGIETLAQLEFLHATRCDLGQGFGLARPAVAEHVARLLPRQGDYAEVG